MENWKAEELVTQDISNISWLGGWMWKLWIDQSQFERKTAKTSKQCGWRRRPNFFHLCDTEKSKQQPKKTSLGDRSPVVVTGILGNSQKDTGSIIQKCGTEIITFFHSITYLSSSSWPNEKDVSPATSATSCLQE